MPPLSPSLSRPLLALSLAIIPGLAGAQDAELVRRGDIAVTKADFDAYMERVPAAMQLQARADGDRNEKVVELIFTNRALARQAREAGFDKDPVVARRIEQNVESFLALQYSNHLEKNAPMPANLEERAREVYLANLERWTVPPRMGLQHILVDLWGRTREMALERIREARAKAIAGEDFLALAAAYSTDPGMKTNKGVLGFPAEKDLDPRVGEAAFRLKADGEISEIVESPSGFHLLKRTGFRPGHVRKFEEVKATLVEEQKAALRSDASMKHAEALRRSPETRWNDEAIASLRTTLPAAELERLQQEALRRREEAMKAMPASRRGQEPAGSAPPKKN